MKMTETQQVAAAAWRIRRYALQMGEVQFRDLKPRNRRASGRKAATPSVKMGLVSGEGTLQPEDKLNLPFQPASIPTLCHRFIANISPLL